jgi:hypothetical protein
MELNIREHSWVARMAALKLRSQKVAIVIGSTIHLHAVSREEFLQDSRWVRHEMCHIRQFKKYGHIPFICRYLLESLRHGY